MSALRKIYHGVTAIESVVVPVLIGAITFLVFASALARTFKYPINWAVDMSLLLLAWTVALGGDLALRKNRVVNVDMIVNFFSPRTRKILALLWCVVMLAFLGCMIWYGYALCLSNRKRVYQTLEIGYIWANASVPVGAALMFATTAIRFVRIWRDLPLAPAAAAQPDPEAGGIC